MAVSVRVNIIEVDVNARNRQARDRVTDRPLNSLRSQSSLDKSPGYWFRLALITTLLELMK